MTYHLAAGFKFANIGTLVDGSDCPMPIPPKPIEFQFMELRDDYPEIAWTFSELTLAQPAFFGGVKVVTEKPHCLRPTPWRDNGYWRERYRQE